MPTWAGIVGVHAAEIFDLGGDTPDNRHTPAADPDRRHIYAAAPDGTIQKLAISDGHVVWTTAMTLLPLREKIASPLREFRGHIIAVTGGYIGDEPPYQGHVAILEEQAGKLLQVWNTLCSDHPDCWRPAPAGPHNPPSGAAPVP